MLMIFNFNFQMKISKNIWKIVKKNIKNLYEKKKRKIIVVRGKLNWKIIKN